MFTNAFARDIPSLLVSNVKYADWEDIFSSSSLSLFSINDVDHLLLC